jgi:Ca2+-binding RTX toxin-like protein
VRGGGGDDTIIEGKTDEWAYKTGYVEAGAGNDVVYGGGNGGSGNDTIDARGYAAAHLTGGSGADTLIGGNGDDIISADREFGFDNGLEVDHLSGGAGNDFIFSGYGDIVDGGDGSDTVAVSYVAATHGITGDTADLHRGLALAEGAGTFQNVERFSDIALTAYNDKMVIGDQAEPAVVRSWDGDDYLIGQRVSITMYGGNGNDMLVGSTANDVLYGEDGNDKLLGYLGSDELWGGKGSDTFYFTETGATDRIGDFESGIDKIDLSAIDANTSMAGDQAFAFIGAASFSGHAGEVRVYNAGTTGYFVALDVNGDGAADLSIQLGSAQPTGTDFIL